MRDRKINCLFGVIVLFLFLSAGSSEVKAYSIGRLEMSADVVTAMPGEEVKVNIDITKNPGICGLKFDVSYADFLTLKEVTFNEAFEPYITSPQPYLHEQNISFVSPYEECTVTGNMVTLTFKVEDSIEADCSSEIILNYYNDDIFDEELKNVPVSMKDGEVKIITAYMDDTITLSEENNVLTAAINSSNNVAEYGIICADEECDVTLNTAGRTRIVFGAFSDEKQFSLNIAESEKKAYRAYFVISTSSGENIIRYSNIVIR